ncbi:hypothetical protein HOLleu_38396 [Holothuria leucospilota]|uniref:Uncharacterized protein n=1 Tax=Holothuria leucospilota TaxID=206669 RepID=A0A9Q0YF37_HOLLE|nr:hypothetical protein HOLleu_38396 [Holothuria leucospilota]
MVDVGPENDHIQKEIILFDFEFWVEADGRHVPNLCIAQVVCELCMDDDDINNQCDNCEEVRQYKFFSVKSFCTWTCQRPEAIFIARNLKGYDGQFILDCFSKLGMPPNQLVTTGTKIMYVEFALLRTSRNKKKHYI